ncbi:MAG: glycoside hydrolase family 3 C-terminal domain-containing protein [Clostridiales bacterium]|nr:glycoside hydrolase family 3 C-terminal domain-containing protein [Clostridiales bacterium]
MNGERLDIEKTLAYLTLDEKLRMLSGDGMWHTFGAGELPRVRMSDGPNGLRMDDGMGSSVPATCFPTASMLACSWDPAMLYSIGAAMGEEATALGVNLLLAPGINVKRHPRGGRNFEYFSEDPYLAGDLAKAFVSGVQSSGVGACIKHYAANNQEDMRMYSDSVIDARALREIYLKPFEIALKAEPEAVMCAYNKLGGEYCSQNKFLLTDVLRNDWKYDGVVVSDWGAVHDRAKALNAGLDLAMPDSLGLFEEQLRDAVASNTIDEQTVDRSLKRILRLIDDVYLEPYGEFDADTHDKLTYNTAAACVVMLKNEGGFLPITKDMHIAVVGELAKTAPIQGGGSSHVSPLKSISPLDAFGMRAVGATYLNGYSSTASAKQNERLLEEAVSCTADCDAVIVYVGQPAPGEGIDRKSLELPPEQNRLINELTAAGRRVVVVLCSAGPVLMPWVNRVRAVIYAGLNGQSGALAAVDALFGRINPRGKLAETFPKEDYSADFGGLMPVYRESIFVGYRYYDKTNTPVLFPFGHGLSFSNLTYDDMHVRRIAGDAFDVTVTLTNNSVRDAYEIVQIYVSDRSGRVLRPEKQLAGYMKVFVEGQTTATATIHLPRSAFEFFDVKSGTFKVPDGEYTVLAAASAQDIRIKTTVKVDGDFFDYVKYPDVYNLPIREKITDDDFKALYGSDLPEKPLPLQRGEFTLDCCINDIKGTLAGKFAKRAVMRRAKSVGKRGSVEYDAFVASAMNTPLSSVFAMSGGKMSFNTANGIVEMANGHYLKGLKLLLKK